MIEYIYYATQVIRGCILQSTVNFNLELWDDFFVCRYDDSEIVSARLSVNTTRKEITLASSISVLQ